MHVYKTKLFFFFNNYVMGLQLLLDMLIIVLGWIVELEQAGGLHGRSEERRVGKEC